MNYRGGGGFLRVPHLKNKERKIIKSHLFLSVTVHNNRKDVKKCTLPKEK